MIIKAGIAVFKDDTILLVHPTGSSWNKPFCSIPKGEVEEHEHLKEAAIREFEEETGLKLNNKTLSGPFKLDYGKDKVMYYYVLRINSYEELGMDKSTVNKNLLQMEEVDWAGFIQIIDARKKLYYKQIQILDSNENMKFVKPYGETIF